MPARPTPILITCSENIKTRITYGQYFIEDNYGESMQARAAQMIVDHAHYNEVFEIQAAKTGDLERALAEADQFKKALRTAMAKKTELNIMILGDNETNWKTQHAQGTQAQKNILRKAKIVADKMAAYPNVMAETDLQKAAQTASDTDLLKAKIFVERISGTVETINKRTKWREEHQSDPLPLGMVIVGAGITVMVLSFTSIGLGFLGLGIPLILIGIAVPLIFFVTNSARDTEIKSEIKDFNQKTGRSEILPELAKISPEFLKELESQAISKVMPYSASDSVAPVGKSALHGSTQTHNQSTDKTPSPKK